MLRNLTWTICSVQIQHGFLDAAPVDSPGSWVSALNPDQVNMTEELKLHLKTKRKIPFYTQHLLCSNCWFPFKNLYRYLINCKCCLNYRLQLTCSRSMSCSNVTALTFKDITLTSVSLNSVENVLRPPSWRNFIWAYGKCRSKADIAYMAFFLTGKASAEEMRWSSCWRAPLSTATTCTWGLLD